MEVNKTFSKREWFFVIALVSVIQGAIWYASFVNSNSGSALNYVSFAGTLISIILAVLAIGYTYGESLSQKNKSDNVTSQIAVLNEVIRSITIESKNLEQISTISDELTRFASKFDESILRTQEKVTDVSNSLGKLFTEYDKYKEKDNAKPIESNLSKAETAKAVLAARSPLTEITFLALFIANGKSYSHSEEMVRENIVKYIDRAKENYDSKKSPPEGVAKLFTGTFLILMSILQGLGLLTEDKENVTHLATELIEEIKNTAISDPSDSGSFYRAIREEMMKDIHS